MRWITPDGTALSVGRNLRVDERRHPGQQLGRGERLPEQLDARLVQALGPEGIGGEAGHQQNGQPGAIAANLPGRLDPVRPRHDEVRDHEIDLNRGIGEAVDGLPAIGKLDDAMTRPGEDPRDQAANAGLVLDDRDSGSAAARDARDNVDARARPPIRGIVRLRHVDRL